MAHDTLVAILAMSGVSVFVLVIRLVTRRLQRTKMDLGDWLALFDILVWGCFLGVVPGVMIWGTNNMTDEARSALVPGSDEVHHREMGSKFLLVDRVMYITVLWVAKGIVWAFYSDLITRTYNLVVLMWCYGVLIVTYIVPIVVTLMECNPLEMYWRVLPDPGNCVRALAQLWCVGTLNMATDVLLMGLLIPVLCQVQLPWYKKAGLSFLFCIGTFLVIITAVRIAMTVNQSHSQSVRSLWGTAEMLGSTCVANAPALYASARKCYLPRPRRPTIAINRRAMGDVESAFPAGNRPSRLHSWSMAWSIPSTWNQSIGTDATTNTVTRTITQTVSNTMAEAVVETRIHADGGTTASPEKTVKTGVIGS